MWDCHWDRLNIELELEPLIGRGSGSPQGAKLTTYLLANPGATMPDGSCVGTLVVQRAVDALEIVSFSAHAMDSRDRFIRSLERDGWILDHKKLKRALPVPLDLAGADDEVHSLLTKFALPVPKAHLDQAIDNHARGNWAASNSQLRTFFESLLDEIALRCDPTTQVPPGEARRQLLARIASPILRLDLNEWSADGKNFINGVMKRLHPMGSHPGVSDEDDCTFRLQLIILIARLLLRRVPS